MDDFLLALIILLILTGIFIAGASFGNSTLKSNVLKDIKRYNAFYIDDVRYEVCPQK